MHIYSYVCVMYLCMHICVCLCVCVFVCMKMHAYPLRINCVIKCFYEENEPYEHFSAVTRRDRIDTSRKMLCA
jgi:hypothetical protein